MLTVLNASDLALYWYGNDSSNFHNASYRLKRATYWCDYQTDEERAKAAAIKEQKRKLPHYHIDIAEEFKTCEWDPAEKRYKILVNVEGKGWHYEEKYGLMTREEANDLAWRLNRETKKAFDAKYAPPKTKLGIGVNVSTAPKIRPELIHSIVRQGHKMIITGSSKAGKSFLLMELATALAYKRPWLGFNCKHGRVLYINMEIDPASCQNRFFKIMNAMGVSQEEGAANGDRLVLLNLRGSGIKLEELADMVTYLVNQTREDTGLAFDAIILDPLYKVLEGDENSAGDMELVCSYLDLIAAKTGCSIIFCHHHAKGFAGNKRMMDRGSGSGVFARDPDAILDITALDMTDEIKDAAENDNATAWRLEGVLREFKAFKPVNFWFNYPVHVVDYTGILERAELEGTAAANLAKSSKRTTPEERKAAFDGAFDIVTADIVENAEGLKGATVYELAEQAGYSMEWVRQRVKEYASEYYYDKKNSLIYKKDGNPFTSHDNGTDQEAETESKTPSKKGRKK